MASTAQVGQGVGSLLGLFLGHKAGSSQRKKRLKAKADLDEKQLAELRRQEALKFRQKAFIEKRLDRSQESEVLRASGITPTELSPEEQGIDTQRRVLSRTFGLTGSAAGEAFEKGVITEPGTQRAPLNIAQQFKTEAGTGKLEAETRLVEKKILTEQQRAESFKQLAGKRKRVESAKSSGKKSEQMSALRTLQSGLLTQIKSLDRAIEEDPLELGMETERQDRADLLTELLGVTKELRVIGGVKEGEVPKVAGGTANRLTTLRTMRRKKLINDENFKLQIKQLFDEKKISPEQALEALTK